MPGDGGADDLAGNGGCVGLPGDGGGNGLPLDGGADVLAGGGVGADVLAGGGGGPRVVTGVGALRLSWLLVFEPAIQSVSKFLLRLVITFALM